MDGGITAYRPGRRRQLVPEKAESIVYAPPYPQKLPHRIPVLAPSGRALCPPSSRISQCLRETDELGRRTGTFPVRPTRTGFIPSFKRTHIFLLSLPLKRISATQSLLFTPADMTLPGPRGPRMQGACTSLNH